MVFPHTHKTTEMNSGMRTFFSQSPLKPLPLIIMNSFFISSFSHTLACNQPRAATTSATILHLAFMIENNLECKKERLLLMLLLLLELPYERKDEMSN